MQTEADSGLCTVLFNQSEAGILVGGMIILFGDVLNLIVHLVASLFCSGQEKNEVRKIV